MEGIVGYPGLRSALALVGLKWPLRRRFSYSLLQPGSSWLGVAPGDLLSLSLCLRFATWGNIPGPDSGLWLPSLCDLG